MSDTAMKNSLNAALSDDDFTIGFEFEIEVDPDVACSGGDDEDDFEAEWEAYERYYYNNTDFTQESYFDDNYQRNFSKFIDVFDAEPVYGYVPLDVMREIELKKFKEKNKGLTVDKEQIANIKKYLKMPTETQEQKMIKLKYLAYALQTGNGSKDGFSLSYASQEAINEKLDELSEKQINQFLGYYTDKAEYGLALHDRSFEFDEEEFENEFDEEEFENHYYYKSQDRNPENVGEVDDVEYDDLGLWSYDDGSFDEEFYEVQNEDMQSGFDNWRSDRPSSRNSGNDSVQYIYENFKHDFRNLKIRKLDGYHDETKSPDTWYVEPDGSLNNGGEIVTAVMDLGNGIDMLKEICAWISNNSDLSTKNTTGLHINIGLKNGKMKSIDLLKLALITGDTKVLKDFGRSKNHYAQPVLPKLAQELRKNNTDVDRSYPMDFNIEQFNKALMASSDKMRTINITKLKYLGYIEFRGTGGSDYHEKVDLLVTTIMRYVRAIKIAMDPNAHKKEYYSKLWTLMSDSEHFNDEKKSNPMMNIVIDNKIIQPVEYEAFKRYVISIDPRRKKYFNEPMKNITFYGNLLVDFLSKLKFMQTNPQKPIVKIMKKILDFVVASGNVDYYLLRTNLLAYIGDPEVPSETRKWVNQLLGIE
jgi:hypothetical protein